MAAIGESTDSPLSLKNESFVLTSKEIKDAIGLECDVCMEQFDIRERPPKPLPCNHSFCLPCLIKLESVSGNDYDKAVYCPTCRTEVDATTLSKLPNDHRIVRGMEAISKAKERFRNVCFKHDCQPLDHFCTKCEVAICGHCRTFDHNESDGHSVVAYSNELKSIHANRFDGIEKSCRESLSKMKTWDQKLSNINKNLQNTVSHEIGKLETDFEKFIKLLVQRKEALMTMVEEKVGKRISEITDETSRNLEKMNKLETSWNYFRASRKSGDLREIFRSQKDLLSQEQSNVELDVNTLCVNYEFRPVHEDSFLLELKKLGDVIGKFDLKLQNP